MGNGDWPAVRLQATIRAVARERGELSDLDDAPLANLDHSLPRIIETSCRARRENLPRHLPPRLRPCVWRHSLAFHHRDPSKRYRRLKSDDSVCASGKSKRFLRRRMRRVVCRKHENTVLHGTAKLCAVFVVSKRRRHLVVGIVSRNLLHGRRRWCGVASAVTGSPSFCASRTSATPSAVEMC